MKNSKEGKLDPLKYSPPVQTLSELIAMNRIGDISRYASTKKFVQLVTDQATSNVWEFIHKRETADDCILYYVFGKRFNFFSW